MIASYGGDASRMLVTITFLLHASTFALYLLPWYFSLCIIQLRLTLPTLRGGLARCKIINLYNALQTYHCGLHTVSLLAKA